jgi:hypothetical protein
VGSGVVVSERPREAALGVAFGAFLERVGVRMIPQRVRRPRQAPRPREVQPDQVEFDAAIRSRLDADRLQDRVVGWRRHVGQKGVDPGGERRTIENPAHQVRLRERRRDEVPPDRLVLDGVVLVVGEEPLGRLHHGRFQRLASGHPRVVEDAGERERGVVVGPDAKRAFLGEELGLGEFHDPVLQRPEGGPPLPGAPVVPQAQFRGEAQEPRPAVGLLEGFVVLEVRDLPLDVVGREPGVDRIDDLGLGGVVEQPEGADQRPVAVHRRVPVETAVEDGVLFRRALEPLGGVDGADPVGELRPDAVQGVFRDRFDGLGVEPVASPGDGGPRIDRVQ